MTYAYLRVSTREQNEERQLLAIEGLGIPEKNIFLDKESGKNFHRSGYVKLKAKLRRGDLLYVKSIDRLGKDLTGTLISDLVLQILSYVAESEYRNIKQRQREGIMAAKANGVKFGRPRIEMTPSFYLSLAKWKRGEVKLEEAAKEAGISPSTFYRRAKETKMSTF